MWPQTPRWLGKRPQIGHKMRHWRLRQFLALRVPCVLVNLIDNYLGKSILSTALTTSRHGGFDLVDSRSLKLIRQLADFQTRMVGWLITGLRQDGFTELTVNQLTFMGELDCGVNHASELARRLGVTRQAIHKSVKDLSQIGWLETTMHPEFGNQKIIQFTREGERLMSRARQQFADLDQILEGRLGQDGLDHLARMLAPAEF
ncbi:MAG: DNA-binding MarR family transcriptional regulator [Paracoccaceae bacterium]|jgi:DNA-binding MarR family transcriptional regulator